MTIDEAIEANELIVKYPKTPIGLYTIKGIELGIEALKWIKENRVDMAGAVTKLLPGETKH